MIDVVHSFTQADDAISRRHGGTGLGLTISRALALQMGGDLVLEDNAEGASFLFTLDLGAAEQPAPAQETEAVAGDLAAVRILTDPGLAFYLAAVSLLLAALIGWWVGQRAERQDPAAATDAPLP